MVEVTGLENKMKKKQKRKIKWEKKKIQIEKWKVV